MATFAVGYKPECTIVTQGCTDPIRPYETIYLLNLDLEYRILKRLGILAYLGHHQFYSLTGNMFIQHYSVNARIYLPLIYWVGFIQGGVGYYRPENGSQVLGYNVGAGFQLPIAGRLALEVSTNFHYVQMDNPPYWLAIQMGFIF